MKRLRRGVYFWLMAGLAFVLTMLGTGRLKVWADDPVAKITETGATYDTLQAAFDAAVANQTIELLSNVSLTAGADVSGTVTLDLKGFTITNGTSGNAYTGDYLLAVKRGGNLTVKDTGEGGLGSISTDEIMCGIKMTIYGETATGAEAVLTIDSGTIKGHEYGITGNGNRHGTRITINDGRIEGGSKENSVGIYQPQEGFLTINDGQIIGKTGIEIRSGNLTLNGGSVRGTATEFSVTPQSGQQTTIGAGIAVSQHVTQKQISVTLTAGIVTGKKTVSVANPQGNGGSTEILPNDVLVSVSPSFASILSTQLPEDYVWKKSGDVYIPHRHTYGTPKWRWLRIDGAWTVTSTYTCEGETGSCGSKLHLTTTNVSESDDRDNRVFSATDSRGNQGTLTKSKNSITASNLEVSPESPLDWGMIASFTVNPADSLLLWTLNWSGQNLSVNRTNTFAIAITENTTVSVAAPDTENQNMAITATLTKTGSDKADYKVRWSLPDGATVISAIIYRGTTSAAASLPASVLTHHGASYDTGLTAANGDFTLHLDGLTAGSYQHIMTQIIYTIDGDTHLTVESNVESEQITA